MLSFLEGGGVAADAIRDHDWAGSAIGPPETWPVVLKTTVGLALASQFPQCIVWGPSLTTIPNAAFLPILGDKPAALGRPFSDVWREVWPSLEPIVARAFAGEATFIEDFALEIDRHGYPEPAWFTFCYSPIRDEFGHVVGMLDTVTETTDKVLLHERQRLLAAELGHRLKNLLAVVASVAGQTLRRSADLQAADTMLALRLAAIGRASDVLTASEWIDADLRDIATVSLTVPDDRAGRFAIDGPAVRIHAQGVMALSLAFHELATNAVKYGALSNEAGRVDLSWTVEPGDADAEPRLVLAWREVGGPAVAPPTRRGFGSLLIERSLRATFRSETVADYRADGLVFTMDAPLSAMQVAPAASATGIEGAGPRA